MSYESTPGEWQGDPAERTQGFGQPAPDPGQGASGYFPPGYGAVAYGKPPPTYLVWARIAAGGGVLFNLILGLPTALIAMQHGRKVRTQWEAQQPAGGHQRIT